MWMAQQQQHGLSRMHQHSLNYMHLPANMVHELKSIYRRSIVSHYLCYCATRVLVSKVKHSQFFRGKLDTLVRPKTNYERSKSVADVLSYMQQRAP